MAVFDEATRKQKYEDYRTKVKQGTPLRDDERAEWKELLKEFDSETYKKDYGDVDTNSEVPTNPSGDARLNPTVANPTPTPGDETQPNPQEVLEQNKQKGVDTGNKETNKTSDKVETSSNKKAGNSKKGW